MKRAIAILILFLLLPACKRPQQPAQAPGALTDDQLLEKARAVFAVIPDTMTGSKSDTPDRIQLGKRLFFETRLSINRSMSCNSCHRVDSFYAGVDNEPTSTGFHGQLGKRNSPTVINAGFQVAQFWDGRAPNLREQAKGPMLNSVEMGMPDSATVVSRLRTDPQYRAAFQKNFPGQADPVTYDNAAEAIAAYERTLITHDRFDEYLKGSADALTAPEKDGLRLFLDLGCTACHSGPLLGGTRFMKSGIFYPYPYGEDLGRYEVTRNEADRFVFKVPMLRNVILTGPYYHDGKVKTIAEGIDLMGHLQLNRKLTNEQVDRLMRFMVALSGRNYIADKAPAVARQGGRFKEVRLDDMPQGADGELIRYGYQLLNNTYQMLGPVATDPKLHYSGNVLACRNCHNEGGTKEFGLPWVGVSARYPQFRAREGRQGTLQDRINGCMERSMNGRTLPPSGREMRAMVAYMDWLSQGTDKNMGGVASPEFIPPDRKVDLVAGQNVYQVYCQSCHGETGTGYRTIAAEAKGDYVVPPLWGKDSYNLGAGMARVLTAAAFIQSNMPLGTPWNHPMLTGEQAYDVAGFINSQERPVKDGLEKDYPDLTKKPVDSPYPPYADKFSREQHRYGPFQPIMDARKKASATTPTRAGSH